LVGFKRYDIAGKIGNRENMQKPKSAVAVIFVAVYLFILPLIFHDAKYFLNVIITCSVLSIMGLGIWITFTLGLVNIGQAAFCTIGAYTTAILSLRYGISFWLCLPISGLVASGIGVLIGIPILRLKGVYFAMITISLGEAVRLLFMSGGTFTGGATGLWGIARPTEISIGGVKLIPAFTAADYLYFYFLSAVLLILVLLAIRRLDRSRIGWAFRAIRQSDALAASVGIHVARYRVMAFGISCFLGGIGGSFMVSYMTTIYPNSYTIADSINFMLFCFIGGLDFILGPVLGTFILVGSSETLRLFVEQEYQALIYAVIMIGAVLWLPNGVLSLSWGSKGRKDALQGGRKRIIRKEG
jgi:branched-chain amino acid transport system permease protein